MGIGRSRPTFIHNDLRDSVHAVADGHENSASSCLACLCPPGRSSSPKSLRSRGSRTVLGGSYDDELDDQLGSPVPDTPDAMRRVRDAAIQKYMSSNGGEEKKSGSFLGTMTKESSKYFGLERESSKLALNEMDGADGNGGGGTTSNAEICDGPDAEARLNRKYELCEVLGVGSTSTVHRCVHLATGESRACKVVDKPDAQSAAMANQFYTEIKTLRSLRHPNIITLYDVYVTEDRIYIVMELMHGGELFDYVVQKGTLTEEEASRIVRKDMKPENLLLAHKPRSSHDVEVKIIDFGLSKLVSEHLPVASSFLGTRGYLAPEMLQRKRYTKSVDAWALGVIVFVLLCGCLPFDDDCQSIPSPDLRRKFTLRFPRWAKDLSPSARDLLNKLLDIRSETRYTAEQALSHPWVAGKTARRDSLLQSPGHIRPSPGGRGGSTQATRDHVSRMVANRAMANAQLNASMANKDGTNSRVRKISI